MNDREMLEIIKSSVAPTRENTKYVLVSSDHAKWLIEQAKRVQELEENNFALMESLRFQDEILERQNKRYREALEQIANSRVTIADGVGNIRIAQRALRGETDEC